MKAIEFLNTMLTEGWTNSDVTTTDCACNYESAREFAEEYACCHTVLLSDKVMKHGYKKGTYALVWIRTDRADLYNDFINKADFIGIGNEYPDCNIYFYHLT